VKKTILVYGLLGGLLIALLKFVEYRCLIIEHSLEVYGGIVALLFSTARTSSAGRSAKGRGSYRSAADLRTHAPTAPYPPCTFCAGGTGKNSLREPVVRYSKIERFIA
jgi:hypothetical protein